MSSTERAETVVALEALKIAAELVPDRCRCGKYGGQWVECAHHKMNRLAREALKLEQAR